VASRSEARADSGQRGEAAGTWCEAPLTVLMRGLPTSSAQWLWSQFTLAHHAFVSLSNAPYLIFKFAVAHWQSFDDDIRAIRHIQALRKQTRTNLEFVHNAHQTVSPYAPNWGKSTQKERLQATSWVEEIPHQIYIFRTLELASRNPNKIWRAPSAASEREILAPGGGRSKPKCKDGRGGRCNQTNNAFN